jgi:hypothetical protein
VIAADCHLNGYHANVTTQRNWLTAFRELAGHLWSDSMVDDKAQIPRTLRNKDSVFFDDPAIDQVMAFFTELMTEVSVLRDRVDTLEKVLESSDVIVPDAVESYVHDADSEARRMAMRKAFLQRVMRIEP